MFLLFSVYLVLLVSIHFIHSLCIFLFCVVCLVTKWFSCWRLVVLLPLVYFLDFGVFVILCLSCVVCFHCRFSYSFRLFGVPQKACPQNPSFLLILFCFPCFLLFSLSDVLLCCCFVFSLFPISLPTYSRECQGVCFWTKKTKHKRRAGEVHVDPLSLRVLGTLLIL